MTNVGYKVNKEVIQVHGNGLLSKEEVSVSISKAKEGTGIVFILNNEKIPVDIKNVSNSNRNTVLSNGRETICLVEHFLSACSMLGIDNIEVTTNKNELVFGDGSALHWYRALLEAGFLKNISTKYELNEALFLKEEGKEISAIPHKGFKVSYYMDWIHPALGKKFSSWQAGEDIKKILCARTFAKKEENDFFGMSSDLLTLTEVGFNKSLNDPLEPVNHKLLDIIGDLRLCGVNPLEINMHVIGFRSGHDLNVKLAKTLKQSLSL